MVHDFCTGTGGSTKKRGGHYAGEDLYTNFEQFIKTHTNEIYMVFFLSFIFFLFFFFFSKNNS